MTSAKDTVRTKRTVRSFVRRGGRLTESQRKALRELWPKYGLEYGEVPLEFSSLFGRDAKRTLEIGFGNGDTLVQQASEHSQRDFLGIEVHEPGVGHCLIAARQAGVENLRLIIHDAVEVLRDRIPVASIDRINLYFPDPWPKKRHHKRRIVQPSFLQLVANVLAPAGSLFIATDWEDYAAHIDGTFGTCDRFKTIERRAHDGDRPLDRPGTKFERRGLGKGHLIWDWQFDRVN